MVTRRAGRESGLDREYDGLYPWRWRDELQAGICALSMDLLSVSPTVRLAGAGPVKVRVPHVVAPPTTGLGLTVNELRTTDPRGVVSVKLPCVLLPP